MAPLQRNSDDELKKARLDYFRRRFPNFKKKATELSVLCGNSVVFVCYTPDDNKVQVWPENRQEIQDIVSKFKNQSDEKRKKHSCDVYDYPNLDGLSHEELRNYLSVINAQLSGVRQIKRELMSEKISSEQRGSGQLGFVSDLGCADGVGVSGGEADSSRLELGFQASEPTAVAYNPSGCCGSDCIWDSSRLDLEFFGSRVSQYFFYVETQTSLALPDEDTCLVVYNSTQAISTCYMSSDFN